MGVSTDALIVYGVNVEEIEELKEKLCEEELEELLDAGYFSEDKFGLIQHCSSEYPLYFVGYRILRASRGCPASIQEKHFNKHNVSDIRIEEFCKQYDLPFSKPQFFLASDWS